MDVLRGLHTLAIASSIAARVGIERVTRPQARQYDDVPYDLTAVTQEWMSAVLCKGKPGAKISSVERVGETAGTSERATYKLVLNDAARAAGLPESVFAKATPSVLTRMANGLSGCTESEGSFYRYMRPELEGVEAPFGYHSAWDLSSFRAIHVLEDLVATKQAEFCKPTTVLTREQADEAVKMMAAYHGKFYNSPRLQTDFGWLRSYPHWWQSADKHFDSESNGLKGIEKAEAIVPPEVFAKRQLLWKGHMQAVASHLQLPPTLLHGDVHLGNWYITGEGHMGLCDWQCVSHGHWSRDLAYALSAILPVESRRAWEEDLIKLYLQTLAECGGEETSFDAAMALYREQLFSALMMWAPTYHHSIFLPDMQPDDVSIEMIARMTTAMADHGVMALV